MHAWPGWVVYHAALLIQVGSRQTNLPYLCHMQEGKRQKQVGGLLLEEINGIFQRLGLTMIDGGIVVSLASVKVTPDLLWKQEEYTSAFLG